MLKIDKHIEIVASGIGAFSCMAPDTRQAVRAILARRYRTVNITLIKTLDDLDALVARQPDLIFLTMKCLPKNPALGMNDPDKIWVSEYLDAAGIAYTGSGAHAVRLEASKQLAKQCVLDAGLASPAYKIVHRSNAPGMLPTDVSFPLFVKPSNRGGGQGIGSDSLVQNAQELTAKINSLATDLQADALIEEYLPGREFSVSILQSADSSELAVMPVEMVADADDRGARILGHTVKRSNVERVLDVPESQLRHDVCALARGVFEALGARDYGRFDIRLDSQGVPHFLEANLYPSLTDGYGSFPTAYKANSGQSYDQMILAIAELGLRREAFDESLALYGEFAIA